MLIDLKNKPLIILETDKDIKFSSNSWGHSFKMTDPFDWKWFWKTEGVWNRFWDWPEFCMNGKWITEFLKKSDAGQPQTVSDTSETRLGPFSKRCCPEWGFSNASSVGYAWEQFHQGLSSKCCDGQCNWWATLSLSSSNGSFSSRWSPFWDLFL